MFDTVFVLLFLAGLLIVVGISQRLAARLKLPQSVVLAAIGIGIGALPAIGSQIGFPGPIDLGVPGVFDKQPHNSAIFIYVFLPLLVFEAGVATDVKRTVQDAAPILVLAVVATLTVTYCQLLVLRQSDFELFMRENPDARAAIVRVAKARQLTNTSQNAVRQAEL